MLTFTRLRARELELEEAEKAALEQVDTQPETVTETVETSEVSEKTESEVQDESLKIPAPESAPKRRK